VREKSKGRGRDRNNKRGGQRKRVKNIREWIGDKNQSQIKICFSTD
jgi:hypothetical protein